MIYIIRVVYNNCDGKIEATGNIYVGTDKNKAQSIGEEKSKNVKYAEKSIPNIDVILEEWEDGRTDIPNSSYWFCR